MDRKWSFFRVLVLTILFTSGGAEGYLEGLDLRSPYLRFQSADSVPVRISALDALSHVSKRGQESEQEKRGFYGFLGCVVNEDLCQEDERCIDDGLFGSCQNIRKAFDRYQYKLDLQQQDDLEQALIQLIRGGYSWRDLYTQCVVGDFLLAFQLNQTPDPDYCNDGTLPIKRSAAMDDWKNERNLDGTGGVEYDGELNLVRAGDESVLGDDEFVNVHKYQKQRRRQPSNPNYSDLPIIQEDANYNTDSEKAEKEERIKDAILQYLVQLKPEDMKALDQWLSTDTLSNDNFEDANERNSNDESDLTELSGSGQTKNGTEEQREQKRVVADNQEERKAKAVISPPRRFDIIDTAHVYFTVEPRVLDIEAAERILMEVARLLNVPVETFSRLRFSGNLMDFRVDRTLANINGSTVASATMLHADEIRNTTGYRITRADVGRVPQTTFRVQEIFATRSRYFVLLLALCGVIVGLLLTAVLLYLLHRYLSVKEKIARISDSEAKRQSLDPSKDYQELCRQHMSSKLNEKPEPIHFLGRLSSVSNSDGGAQRSPSSRSSTSSWSEEPVSASMDILTGHMILSYMEDHLKTKDRLNKEWESLKAYEPEIVATTVADQLCNKSKNRYFDVVPYDHSRVILQKTRNQNVSDYINASTITDHDPRNPAYIVTQGPLQNTVADFWQMVWEHGCVVIVNLTKLKEKDTPLCHTYWPSEGSVVYHTYEINLVSEHIWCDDYLIRSFYLKNLQTNETRTVTQFHYVTWPDLGVPTSCKALLDFRRKVNKSFRGRSCPILVHCSDGAGRSGTYCLIDMVLNRISKGAKEIDIAATLEHIRDQRMQAVKTKEQFQFVLATVAEEVHAILKALPQ